MSTPSWLFSFIYHVSHSSPSHLVATSLRVRFFRQMRYQFHNTLTTTGSLYDTFNIEFGILSTLSTSNSSQTCHGLLSAVKVESKNVRTEQKVAFVHRRDCNVSTHRYRELQRNVQFTFTRLKYNDNLNSLIERVENHTASENNHFLKYDRLMGKP